MIPHAGFNYCFWSKLLVAIVLFPLVMIAALEYFKNSLAGAVAGVLGIAALIYAAYWIDRIPLLTCKIPALIGRKKTPDA
jgi:hypothetical protein